MSKFLIFFSPKFLFALSCYKFRLLMSILKTCKEREVNQSTKENILTSYLDTKNNSLCKIIRQNLLIFIKVQHTFITLV